MSKRSRILCRAVTALLALSVLPNLFFNGLVYFRIDPGVGKYEWADSLYISHFMPDGLWNGLLHGGGGAEWKTYMPLLRPAILAGVLLALAALCLVAVAVVAAVSNKKIPLLALCGAGLLLVAGAYFSFGRFAANVTDPSFNLIGLLGENFLLSIIGSVLQVEVLDLRLANAASMTVIIFAAVAVWNLAFWVTAPKADKKESKHA